MKNLGLEQLATLSCARVLGLGGPQIEPEQMKQLAAQGFSKRYGADFQPDEFHVSETQFMVTWRPPIAGYLDGELHGGPCDGMVIPNGYNHGHVFVARYERPVGRNGYEQDKNVPAIKYHFDGWNTETKRWIYRAEPMIQL